MIRWRVYDPNPFRDMLEMMLQQEGRWREPNRGAPMPINVHQTDSAIVVEAALPGVRPEEVEISSQEGLLTIRGRTHVEPREYLHQEMHEVEFHRQVALPVECRFEDARAEYEHGILTVVIPKRQPRMPEKIRIQVNRVGGASTIEAAKGEGYSEVDGDAPARRPRKPRA